MPAGEVSFIGGLAGAQQNRKRSSREVPETSRLDECVREADRGDRATSNRKGEIADAPPFPTVRQRRFAVW